MELLDQGRIAGETARIEALHLADQFLNLFRHFGVFLHGLAKLIQIAHAVVVRALRGNGGIVGLNRRSSARRVVSRVKVAVQVANASAARIVAETSTVPATADSRARPTDGTAPSLAAALTLLTTLLPTLALTLSLAWALLSLLASLAIARKRTHLVAKPLDTVQSGFESLLRIITLLGRGTHGLLRVTHTFFEALHAS